MKNNKAIRILVLALLTVALVIGASFTSFAADQNTPSITVNQVTAEGGTSVDVPISISGNPGICGATISVSYDTSLTLTKVVGGEALSGLDMTKPGKLTANPIKILWSGTEEDSSNGTIAVLTFTTPKSPGAYPVQVSYDSGDIMNGSYLPVDFQVTNGGITIEDPEAQDREAAQQVEALINAMDPSDESSVVAARSAYDALTPAQKEMVNADVLKILTDAEEAIRQAAEQQAADQRALDNVVLAINAINPGDRASVEAARAAYDALEDRLKSQIPGGLLAKLEEAEEAIRQEDERQAENQAAADAVANQIAAMDPNDPESVQAARTAYDNLTDAQKALIDASVKNQLEEAEAAIQHQEDQQIADQSAAELLIEKINNMDASSWESVEEVRQAYEALTEAQKKLVTNADILENAIQAMDSVRIDINTLSFEKLSDERYDGYEWFPGSFCIFLTTDEPWVIYEGTDYTVEWRDNIEVGTGTVILTGIGQYKGTKELHFQIKPIDMSAWELSFGISKTKYVYDGKVKTPKFGIRPDDEDYYREEPTANDYTMTCSTDRKSVGTHKMKFTFRGNFTGSLTYSFTIVPKGTTLSKLTPKKKKMIVKWKKQGVQTTGYQIQYSLKKNFKGAKNKLVKKSSTKVTIKKLKSKKKYFVRIRTYKKVNGKMYYSAWSKAKTVKIK